MRSLHPRERETARALAAAVLVFSFIVFDARPAAADAHAEAVAQSALSNAASDYEGEHYQRALYRLNVALKACAHKRCVPGTVAALERDVGAVQFRRKLRPAAKKAWMKALHLQPDIALNSAYDAPDLREAWEAQQRIAGVTPAPEDLKHAPIAEQRPDTPLPVYVPYEGKLPLAHVFVHYRSDSAKDWASVPLAKMAGGWGGLVPCTDVAAPALQYWVEGFDANNESLARWGDVERPYTVAVHDTLAGPPPHLPDQAPPASCEEPPAEKEAEGTTKAPPSAPEEPEEPRSPHARFWIGVAGALDFAVIPGATNACRLGANLSPAGGGNYYCTNPDGSDFPSAAQNMHLTAPGGSGDIGTSFVVGDTRALVALDAALTDNVLFGARLGYVLTGYSGAAAVRDGRALGPKIHAEIRGTYVFGRDPMSREGFAPTAFVGGGYSEFDAQTSTTVTLDNVAGSQTVRVWMTDAPFFVTAGAGVRYQFSPRIQLTVAGRLNVAFGSGFVLPTWGPEMTVQYGF
ncbi:MAG TPA: hypothetical protein VGM06_14620 [Polyangiaceae bacterium]